MWEFRSPTRDPTRVPCMARRLFTTGPPGKSLSFNSWCQAGLHLPRRTGLTHWAPEVDTCPQGSLEGSTPEAMACLGGGLRPGVRRATTCFLGVRPHRKALAALPSLSREWVPRFFRARIKMNHLLAPSMYFYALKQALSEEFYLHQLTNSPNKPMRGVLTYPQSPVPCH